MNGFPDVRSGKKTASRDHFIAAEWIGNNNTPNILWLPADFWTGRTARPVQAGARGLPFTKLPHTPVTVI